MPGSEQPPRPELPPAILCVVVRERRAILRGAAVASVASGVPSSAYALLHGRDPLAQGLAATRAIGTLVRPGTPGLLRGALAHGAISLVVGGALGVTLPRRYSITWGALAGLAIGWVNLGVIASRRYPAIASLPLGPQLADNAAFGAIFAAVARPV
jgi:hypothetical protein